MEPELFKARIRFLDARSNLILEKEYAPVSAVSEGIFGGPQRGWKHFRKIMASV